jgi:glycogen operon protein
MCSGLSAIARAERASLIALNPLHMLFPGDRSRASPYHPSDRRFLDPLYLDVATLGGAPAAALAKSELIDYAAVWAAKAPALEAAAAEIESNGWEAAARAAFVAARGEALADFCAFQAIAEQRLGEAWRDWPAALQDPRSAETAAFAAAHTDRIGRHATLQWLCDRQLAEAARGAPELGLCRDLAVGAAPDGAEAWAAGPRIALVASIGAPPDSFAPQGQVWGLPPPQPHAWRREAYASFAGLLRANMAHAGALRVDHVLGLARLFWVPAGAEGADGAYVSYPLQDLLGVLALESRRAQCLVVGEDLGTVPEGLREALAARGVYGFSVLPFERDGETLRAPSAYRPRAVACVATHDLPPFAGWWDGADIDERLALGLLDRDAHADAVAERTKDKAMLVAALGEAGLSVAETAASPFSTQLSAAVHAFVGAAASRLALVQLDDLGAQRKGVNLPGTDRERPNWRLRTERPLDELAQTEAWRLILEAMRRERPLSHSPG